MKLTNEEKKELIKQSKIALARESFWDFCKILEPDFYKESRPHLKLIATTLQDFYEDKLINPKTKKPYKRLMINLPPRMGKCLANADIMSVSEGLVELKEIKVGDEIYSHHNKELVKQKVLDKVYVGKKHYIEFKTKTGRSIKVSPEHRLLTFEGYKQAKEISEKDFLYTLNTEIDSDFEIPDDELKLISYMIFEGHCKKNFGFTNADKEVQEDFIKICENLNIPIRREKSKDCQFGIKLGKEKNIEKLLEKYNIKNHLAYTKRLPKEFFKMSKRQKWIFVGIMFSTDGYYCYRTNSCGIALANEKLIDDIQYLLSTLGIVSSKRYKKNNKAGAWILHIGGFYIEKIIKNADLKQKTKHFIEILNNKPYFKSHTCIYPANIKKGLKGSFKLGKHFQDYNKNVLLESFEKLYKHYPNQLEKYKYKDFFWDKIKKIEKGKEKIDMWDIMVSETENFIANGLVSHNSRTLVNFDKWVLGKNINEEFIVASFSDDSALEFSRFVRDGIQADETQRTKPDQILYKDVFPGTTVKKNDSSVKKWSLNGHHFNFMAVGLNGRLTGVGATIKIIDDLVKSADTATNDAELDKIWKWYAGTFKSRSNTKVIEETIINEEGKKEKVKKVIPAKEIIVMTQWTKKDVCGRILNDPKQKDNWYHLSLEVYDEEKDEMLCDELMPKDEYWDTRQTMLQNKETAMVFWANYHQRQIDIDGGLYGEFKTWQYSDLPRDKKGELLLGPTKMYVDVADKGTDFLCAIAYNQGIYPDKNIYIKDILFTDKSKQEGEIAEFMVKNKVLEALFESNNGGDKFGEIVDMKLQLKHPDYRCIIKNFHQSANKRTRILTNAGLVQQYIYMPHNWIVTYPKFYVNVMEFNINGKNNHDDGPDTLTGIIEKSGLMKKSNKMLDLNDVEI